MTTKILTCALLLVAATACGGGNAAKSTEEATKTEPKTAVQYSAEITLVQPDLKSGTTINEALAARRSVRTFSAETLSLEELSGVLWAAAGVNSPEGKLTAPSAMALYPIRVYAFFKEGAYSYDSKTSKLTRVSESDLRHMTGVQSFVDTAPLDLVYIADRSVYKPETAPEDVRVLCTADAAGYAENVNLYVAGHGMGAVTRASYDEAGLLKALDLDPARYFIALAQTVGK